MEIGEAAGGRTVARPPSVRQFKQWLIERDRWTCGICDDAIESIDESEVDHIVPTSSGGGHDPANLQAAHRVCNQFKLDRPLAWARRHIRAHLLARSTNAVVQIIDQLGGERAAHIAGVRAATIYGWKKAGHITLLGPAWRLIEAVESAAAAQVALLRRLLPPAKSDQ